MELHLGNHAPRRGPTGGPIIKTLLPLFRLYVKQRLDAWNNPFFDAIAK
jgi:hypothetical protein